MTQKGCVCAIFPPLKNGKSKTKKNGSNETIKPEIQVEENGR